MFRLLLFMHHIAFAPHALHHVDIGSCMCICDRSCGAGIGYQKGVNPRGVRRSTSAKCGDTYIAFGSRKAPVHLTLYFSFFLYILFMNLACALGCRSWIDALVA
jgi:hypothetical protein